MAEVSELLAVLTVRLGSATLAEMPALIDEAMGSSRSHLSKSASQTFRKAECIASMCAVSIWCLEKGIGDRFPAGARPIGVGKISMGCHQDFKCQSGGNARGR
jgi:hypothetical protein